MDEVDRLLEEEEDDAAEEQMAFLDDLDPSAAVVPAVADVDTTTWVRPALPADMSPAKDKIGASPSLCALSRMETEFGLNSSRPKLAGIRTCSGMNERCLLQCSSSSRWTTAEASQMPCSPPAPSRLCNLFP